MEYRGGESKEGLFLPQEVVLEDRAVRKDLERCYDKTWVRKHSDARWRGQAFWRGAWC